MSSDEATPKCGIVMPISKIGDCDEEHWNDVLKIIEESVENAGFEGNMVSDSDEVSVIQKSIIQNLYDNPIVVCDVSCKNPNVMFELGIRLAFDKPTVIIIDDETAFNFDTAVIEHLIYPRDLRFNKIIKFKKKLTEKITATLKKSLEDDNYSTFLKHFGEFKVAKIDQKELSGQQYIIEEIKDMKTKILRIDQRLAFEFKASDHEEPSMDEILASIRRIIAEDPQEDVSDDDL